MGAKFISVSGFFPFDLIPSVARAIHADSLLCFHGHDKNPALPASISSGTSLFGLEIQG